MDRLISEQELLKHFDPREDWAVVQTIKAIPSAESYKGMTNGEVITKILKDAEWAELSSDFGLAQEDTIYIKVGGYWWNSPYVPQESDHTCHTCHTCKHYTSGERDGSCGSYICKGYSNWESEDKE